MLSVVESFIQCASNSAVLQHSAEFSGLDANTADHLQQSLAEFHELIPPKISYFQVAASHHAIYTSKEIKRQSLHAQEILSGSHIHMQNRR